MITKLELNLNIDTSLLFRKLSDYDKRRVVFVQGSELDISVLNKAIDMAHELAFNLVGFRSDGLNFWRAKELWFGDKVVIFNPLLRSTLEKINYFSINISSSASFDDVAQVVKGLGVLRSMNAKTFIELVINIEKSFENLEQMVAFLFEGRLKIDRILFVGSSSLRVSDYLPNLKNAFGLS